MSDSPLSLPPPLKHPTSLSKHGRHPSSLSQLSNSSNSSSASAANSPSMSAKKSTWKRVVSPVSGSSGSTRSSGKESGSTNRTSVSPPPASNSPVKRSGSGILKSATGSVRKKDFGNVEKDLEGGGQTMGRRRGLSLRRTEGGRVSEEIKERNQRIIDSLNSSSSDNLPPPISRTSTDSSTSHFSSSSTTSSKSKSAEAGFLARSPSPKKIGSIRRKPRERESTGGGMEYFASGKRNSVVDLHSSDLVTPTKRGGKAIESDEDDTPKSGPRAYDALNSSSFSNPNPTLATTSTMRRIPDALATPRTNDREGEKGRRTRTGESKTLGYRNSIALSVDLKRTRDLRALGFDHDDDPLKRVPASASGPLRSFTSMSHYSSRERERDRPSTVEKEYRRASSRTSSRGDEDTKKSRRYSDSFRRSLDLVGSSRPVKSPPPPLPSTRARPKLPDFWEQQREESGGGSVSFPSSATSESWEKEREREVDYELVGEGEAPRNGGRWEHARPPSLSKRTGEYSRRGAAGEDEDVTVSSGGFSGGRRSAGGAPSAGGGSLDGYRSRTASLLGGRSTGSGGGGSAGAIERSRKTSVTSVGSGSGRLSGRYGEDDGRFPRSPRTSARTKSSYSPTTSSGLSGSVSKRYNMFDEGSGKGRGGVENADEELLSELRELRERISTLEKRPLSRSGHSSGGGSADSRLREPIRLNSSVSSRDRDRERTLRRSLTSNDPELDDLIFANGTGNGIGSGTGSIRRRERAMMSSPTEAKAHTIGFGFGRERERETLSRSESTRSRNSGVFDVKEHHKLLHDSLSYFETHFSTTIAGGKEDQLPESLDLIKRMSAIVTATSKLNAGLRNLVAAVNDAHVEAQLDESQTGSSVSGLVAFEKNTNQLLRISDDQVRSITEGLIAFTRADRERQRLMKDSTLVGTPGSASRPTSRTGSAGYRSITPSSPQKTPFVSPSPAQEVFTFPSTNKTGHHPRPSSTKPAPPLRDPLEGLDRDDPSPSLSRATSVGARMLKRYSPILGTGPADSPTPAGGFGRSDSLHVRSPLSHSRNGSMEDPDLVRPIVRRAKTSSTSATTVRGAVNQSAPPHLLRSPQTADPATINENADTTRSPTRDMDHSGMTRSRTVSDAAAALEPVVEQQDCEKDMVSRRHTLSAGTARSLAFLQNDEEAIPVTPVGKEPRKRMSTGAGAASALRQGLSGLMSGRRRGNTIDRENAAEGVSSPFHAASSSIATSTPSLAQRSAERRKEVEAILRRTVGRSSIS